MKSFSLKTKRKLKSHRENKQQHTEASSSSDFSFAVTKVAVAQVCKSVGFRRTQQSALDSLTVVAAKYLETLARSAAAFSNAENRTQSNVFDLTNALHDVSAVYGGFQGGSALHSGDCLLKSSVLKDLSDFVTSTNEIPFAKPIEKEEEKTEKSALEKAEIRFAHIPEWLPGFPDIRSQAEIKERAIREQLWENSSLAPVMESAGFAVVKKNKSGTSKELAAKRARVSFSIGGGKRDSLNGSIGESSPAVNGGGMWLKICGQKFSRV